MDTTTARSTTALDAVLRRPDLVMSGLLLAHFPVALGLASVHGTRLLAVVVGGAASLIPLALAQSRPGAPVTRFAVAIGFITYSVLFIDQTHGMLEMHFHIFGGLAFMVVYRDWRVPVGGASGIAGHHNVFDQIQRAGGGGYPLPPRTGGIAQGLLPPAPGVFP